MARAIYFVIKRTPPLEEIAGLYLDGDSLPLESTLSSMPALINGDNYTPVDAYWEFYNSYGFELGGQQTNIDGIDIWMQIDTTSSIYSWEPGQDVLSVYGSSDNSTWELIKTIWNPPIFQSGSGIFATRIMFEQPIYYKYFKIRNNDNSDRLTAEGGYDVQICEVEHRIEETPSVIWSSTEQHSDYGGAMVNPVVAVKQTNTVTCNIIATLGRSSGKYHFEIDMYTNNVSLTNCSVGIRRPQSVSGADYSSYIGSSGRGGGYMAQGRFYREGSLLVNEAQLTWGYTRSFTIGVSVDLDNMYVWFSRDGVIVNKTGDNGNPTTGVDPAITGLTAGTYYPAVAMFYSLASNPPIFTSARLNAKASNILYLPSGYSPWES